MSQRQRSLLINGSFEQGPAVARFLNVGSPQSIQLLSENRAGSVREWLVANGIAAARIMTKGFGATVPVATNETAEGRQKNRRVDVRVQK